ncbi:hypothetical protein F0562_003457 [Nyssa sinensis]|uniref:Putative plant transposon protein domain-containing protein n=1 Tax=Nyssa sinensis TaxID=561372 RepID=A0A5J5BW29_9ASTE|nr:hypothetical protein F0562_003457 [Nyssa sinensis]
MAPSRRLATKDQFPFAISLVPRPRNPLLYRSAIAYTRLPIIQGREFWPEQNASPIDKPLVRKFHAELGDCSRSGHSSGPVCGIFFYLTPALIVKTLGIPMEDQPSFPYAQGAAPREEVLARALRRDKSNIFRVIGARLSQGLLSDDYRFLNLVVSYDLSLVSHTNILTRSHSTLLYAIATGVPINGAYVIFSTIDGAASRRRTAILPFGSIIPRICEGQGVPIYTSDMVRELFGPFTRRTLMQYERHVGPAAADATEDMEVDAVEGGGAVPDEDYLVDQMPPQYHRDPSPPYPFYPDPGASSSSAPPPITRGDLEEYF